LVTNTLTSTDDDLGDTVATYVFDIRLARSLLLVSGLAFVGCAVTWALMTSIRGEGGISSVLISAPFAVTGLLTAWGVAVAATRLRRSDDLFVVHRLGLAHHHDSGVTRTRWVDIASVDHVGPEGGSRTARWNGSDYVCRVERRDGTSVTFDNYIIDAPSLGRAIEQRSLL